MMLRFLLPLLLAQTPDADDVRLRIAVQLELLRLQQQTTKAVTPAPKPKQRSYAAARDEAVATGKPLVVAVGCVAPKGEWVVVEVPLGFRVASPSWKQTWQRPSLILMQPKGDFLYNVDTLPPSSTWQDVFDAFADYHGAAIRESLRRQTAAPVRFTTQC